MSTSPSPTQGASLPEAFMEEGVTPRLGQLGRSKLTSGILLVPLDPGAEAPGGS